MAVDTKISDMVPGGTFDGTEIFPVVQGGFNRRSSISQVSPFLEHDVWSADTNILRFGKFVYPASYFPDSPNSYFVIDRGDTDSDASILLRHQGNGRVEIGLFGDVDPFRYDDFSVKTVTGSYLSEVFTIRFSIHAKTQADGSLVGTSDFYGPGPLRVFRNSGKAVLVLGTRNGLEYPDSTGSGLSLFYDMDADEGHIKAETAGVYNRNINYWANNHKWHVGPVNWLQDVMVLNSAGALNVGDPIQLADHAFVSNSGDGDIGTMSGHTIGQIYTALGGTGTPPTFTGTDLLVASATINNAGSGGSNGSRVFTVVTGGSEYQAPQFNGTVAGGMLVSIDSWVSHGGLTTDPPSLTGRAITGGSLTGGTVNIAMGVKAVVKTTDGAFTKTPGTPVQTTSSGAGVNATLDIFYQNDFGSVNALEYWADGNEGVSGSFTTADAKTVTVTTGLITAIV